MSIVNCLKLNKAFTLLELLLVIAIIAVLAGLVIFNLRPAETLQNASDVKNVANSKDIKKAIEAYILDHGGSLPTSLQGQTSGEYSICKQDETSCPEGSISLDELITGGYLSAIPVDENTAGEKTTGYAIEYDATLGTIELVISYTPSPTPPQWDETNGLIAYWPLNEISGTTTDDASINSYTGTLVNMDSANDWVVGKFGNALDFDGVNDWVDFPNGFANFTGGISIGFWIYPTTTGYWSRFVELGNGCLNSGTILVSRYGTSNSIAYQSRGTGNQVLADEVLTLNEWQHFVITQDASANVKIYKNSISQITSGSASLPTNVTRSSNWLSESGCGHGYDSYFAGRLDDIRVYNKALTEQEVGYLYVLVP